MVSAALVAALSACEGGGGGGGSDDGSIGAINCAGLTGATAAGSVACTVGDCSVNFHGAAIDGDLATYATLTMAPTAGGRVSFRATAQDGVTYPAGTPAAVVYGLTRTDGNSTSTAETISTYLDGTLQQTSNTGSNNGVTGGNVSPGRHAMSTFLPFDAIEVTYAQSGGTANVEVQIYEFCTSTN